MDLLQSNLEESKSSYQSLNEQLQLKIVELAKQIESRKQTEADMSAKLNDQTAQSKYFQSKEIEAKTQYNETLSKLKEVSEKYKKNVEQLQTLKQESEQTTKVDQARHNEAQAKIKELEESVRKASEHVSRLKSEAESSAKMTELFSNKIAQFENDKKISKEKYHELERQICELNNKLNEKAAELESLQTRAFSLDATNLKLQDELVSKKEIIKVMDLDLQFKSNQVEKLEQERDEQKQIVQLKENARLLQIKNQRESEAVAAASHPPKASSSTANKKEKAVRDDKIIFGDDQLSKIYDHDDGGKNTARTSSSRQNSSGRIIKTSGTSLRKTSRSKTNLNAEEPAASTEEAVVLRNSKLYASTNSIDQAASTTTANFDEPVAPVSILKKRSSVKNSTSKIKKKATVSVDLIFSYETYENYLKWHYIFKDDKPMEEEEEEKPLEPVVPAKKSKVASTEIIEINDDSPDEYSEMIVEKEANKKGAIKKKSTLARLTDMITKSPILEPLRSSLKILFVFEIKHLTDSIKKNH